MGLKQAGKIRHYGVSNLDLADMQELWSVPGGSSVATDQLLYNLARRGIESDVLPWLRERRGRRTRTEEGDLVPARVKPGVSIEQAQHEMTSIAGEPARRVPTTNKGWSASVEPLQNNFLSAGTRTTLWLLLAAVGFVVTIRV